jgi:hypothetical protein
VCSQIIFLASLLQYFIFELSLLAAGEDFFDFFERHFYFISMRRRDAVKTDDIALIARRLPDLKEFFIQLARVAKKVGLEVNEKNTNYLVASRRRIRHVRRVQLIMTYFVDTPY